MKRQLAFLVPVLLLAARLVLFAQDQATAEKAPRRILFALEKGLIPGYSTDELIVVKRSFLTVLSEADGAPTPVEYGPRAFPRSLADRNKAARDAGADCWLVLRISGPRETPSVAVVSYDLLYNTTTLDFAVTRPEAFAVLDVYRDRWDDVVPRVVKKYPPLASQAYSRGPPAPVTLTIHAVAGTVITGLSPKALSVGPKGTASIDLPSPASYSLRAVARGYIPSGMSIYLNGQTELTLDQARSPWLYLDAAFLDGLFPGIGATFSIPSVPVFARLGFATFRIGIAVNQDQFAASLPLSQITSLLGFYLSPEDNPTRWYIGAGPLLRISIPPGDTLVTIDSLLPWGVQLVMGAEFPLAGAFRSFVEYAPSGYATPEPALFLASVDKDNSTFPYINFPPTWTLNLLELRAGLRWRL